MGYYAFGGIARKMSAKRILIFVHLQATFRQQR
jgi:hypothetical protein